jgi:CubicO group peptidase (beta-lactamase class C family)
MFGIQSISKNITALAVMIAAEEGMLDIDVPISEYLPEFKVNTCFEQNPETKITLRTASFQHIGFAPRSSDW